MTTGLKCCKFGNISFKETGACTCLPPEVLEWLGASRFNPKIGEYHVTSLVGCLGCAYDSFTSDSFLTPAELWKMRRGTLLHGITYAFRWRELETVRVIESDQGPITITAHLDAYSPERETVYDFKSTNQLLWQVRKGDLPRQTHVAQIRGYYSLFRDTIPVKRLELLYMDLTDFQAYPVSLEDNLSWLITRAKALHSAILSRASPDHESSLCFRWLRDLATAPLEQRNVVQE